MKPIHRCSQTAQHLDDLDKPNTMCCRPGLISSLRQHLELVHHLALDVLEVAARFAGLAVDVEGEEERAEGGSLAGGVDEGPLALAAIREAGGQAALLVA